MALLAAASLGSCVVQNPPNAAPPASSRSPAKAPYAWPELAEGWTKLQPPPLLMRNPVAVWTGRELVLWGGDTNDDGGAIYDPAADGWTRLPQAPISGGTSSRGVWTGKEVVVFDGARGAAYDPAANGWRRIADSPTDLSHVVAVAWTGREVVTWGDLSRASRTDPADGAAYDPATDSWRSIAPAPFDLNQATGAWTGRELIVFGSMLDGNNWSAHRFARGEAYDPATDTWRELPASSLSPQASTVAWTGSQLLAWDYGLEAELYDPAADAWLDAPDLPLADMECYPASAAADAFVLASYCGAGAWFDVAKSTWHRVKFPHSLSQPVKAGEVVLVAGASYEGCCSELWAFRPPPTPSGTP